MSDNVKLRLAIKGELVYEADPKAYGVSSPTAMAAIDQESIRDDLSILVDQLQQMSDEQLIITVEPVQ